MDTQQLIDLLQNIAISALAIACRHLARDLRSARQMIGRNK